MVTSAREIRVVASPSSAQLSHVIDLLPGLVAGFLALAPLVKGEPEYRDPGFIFLLAFWGLVMIPYSLLIITKMIQCRQVWRFEEDAAVLVTGSRKKSIPYEGLSLHPHWLALFLWAVRPDGRRKLIPLPGFEGGLETAFLAEMSRRGVEVKTKEWQGTVAPLAAETLRSRIKDRPASFENEQAPFVLIPVLISALIGWGSGFLVVGLGVGAALLGFTLMLYPNAFRLVKKSASELPINELLYDVRFEPGRVFLTTREGEVLEAALGELELVQEERLSAGGAYEHRLALRREGESLLPLTVWEAAQGQSTGWIRAALLDRGVSFRLGAAP